MVEAAKPLGPQSTSREPLRAIFLAILLGLLAGFVHGWNLSLAALLILVVFFNVRARLFFAIWFLGVALSWLLVPMSYAAGRFVLDRTPVGELFGLLGDTPVVSLFGWDRYSLVGGAVIALLLAVPAYVTIRGWLQRFRVRDDVQPAPERQTTSSGRLVRWLLLTEHKSTDAVADTPLVRPLGLWAALIATGAVSMGVWWIAPKRTEAVLLTQLGDACGSPVSAGSLALDLWGGTLSIENLTVSDSDVPAQDRLRIEKVFARLDPTALLQGRLHLEQVDIDGVTWRADLTDTIDELAADAVAPLRHQTELPNEIPNLAVDPEQFVRSWPQLENSISKLQQFVALIERGQQIDQLTDAGQRKRQRFAMRYLTQRRSSLGMRSPVFYARNVAITGFSDSSLLGPKASLRLTDLCSHAVVSPRATRLEVSDPGQGLRLCAQLNLRELPHRHRVELTVGDIALCQHLVPASSTQRLMCDEGRAALTAEGWLAQGALDLKMQIQVKQLSAQLTGQAPIADIPIEAWNEALASLRELQILAHLSATSESLDAQVITTDLRRDIDQRLRKQGAVRLATAFSVPGDITHPSARIVATRAVPTDRVGASFDPAMGAALGPLPHQRGTVASTGVPAGNSTERTRPRLERLPEVAQPTTARAQQHDASVSITFTPPAKPAAKAIVHEAPEVATSQIVADPWRRAVLDEEFAAETTIAAVPPTSGTAMAVTPDVDFGPEFDEESPAAKGRWTDEAVAKLSHLFKFKERDPVPANPFNEAAEELEVEQRLSDTRDGSRFGSTRQAAPPTVRIVR